MDTTQLLSDATTDGQALLADAETAGTSLLNSLAGTAETAIPKFESDAEKTLLEFFPAFIRLEVEGMAGSTLSSIEAASIALVKKGLGIALLRIGALPKATVSASASA